MTMDRIITIIGLLVAAVAAFVDLEWWPLILLLLGLINGFIAPLADMLTRTAYTVVAAALPPLPIAGGHSCGGHALNAIFDNIAHDWRRRDRQLVAVYRVGSDGFRFGLTCRSV